MHGGLSSLLSVTWSDDITLRGQYGDGFVVYNPGWGWQGRTDARQTVLSAQLYPGYRVVWRHFWVIISSPSFQHFMSRLNWPPWPLFSQQFQGPDYFKMRHLNTASFLRVQPVNFWVHGTQQEHLTLVSAVSGTIRAKPRRLGLHRLQGKTAGPEISSINHGGVYTPLSLRGPVFIQSAACVHTDSCKCGHSQGFYEMLWEVFHFATINPRRIFDWCRLIIFYLSSVKPWKYLTSLSTAPLSPIFCSICTCNCEGTAWNSSVAQPEL